MTFEQHRRCYRGCFCRCLPALSAVIYNDVESPSNLYLVHVIARAGRRARDTATDEALGRRVWVRVTSNYPPGLRPARYPKRDCHCNLLDEGWTGGSFSRSLSVPLYEQGCVPVYMCVSAPYVRRYTLDAAPIDRLRKFFVPK